MGDGFGSCVCFCVGVLDQDVLELYLGISMKEIDSLICLSVQFVGGSGTANRDLIWTAQPPE